MQPEIEEKVKVLAKSIKHPGQREMFGSIWGYSKRSALRYAELVCFVDVQEERCSAIELQALITDVLRKKQAQKPARQTEIKYRLISPQGEEVGVSNVTAFCKQIGAFPSDFYRLVRGEYKSIKGWELKENCTKFRLISPQGKVCKVAKVTEFCRDNKIHPNYFYQLVSGKRQSYKGWRVC